jgi:hypothetical protein
VIAEVVASVSAAEGGCGEQVYQGRDLVDSLGKLGPIVGDLVAGPGTLRLQEAVGEGLSCRGTAGVAWDCASAAGYSQAAAVPILV